MHMQKIKILKSFQTYADAQAWATKILPNENFSIHKTNVIKSMSKGRGRIPSGRYHVIEREGTLKSFEKHGFQGKTQEGLNALAQSGHLLPMIRQGDSEHHMVTVAGRHMVLANINGQTVPFYHSTGMGGKKDVQKGQWYPLMGIGHRAYHEIDPFQEKGGIWLNKGNQNDINNYYGSRHLHAFAHHLDSITGNILDSKLNTVELEREHDRTYDAYRHPETGERATRPQIHEWILKNGGKFELHPEGPTSNFLGDFVKNINRKMGIESVGSFEESGASGRVRDNASRIIQNIENSTTPNMRISEPETNQRQQQTTQQQTQAPQEQPQTTPQQPQEQQPKQENPSNQN